MAQLREQLSRASIAVLDEQARGQHYAERHVIELHRLDGGQLALEVFVFAQRDTQGRFLCIEEVSQSWTVSP